MVSEAEPNKTGENMQLNTGLLCDAIAIVHIWNPAE